MSHDDPTLCAVCGAPLADAGACDYDAPEDRAPWRGDYQAMADGRMTHEQHALVVARWGLHRPDGQSEKALTRFRELSATARGQRQTLFPVDE